MIDKSPIQMIIVVVGCLKQDTKIGTGIITDIETDVTVMVSSMEAHLSGKS